VTEYNAIAIQTNKIYCLVCLTASKFPLEDNRYQSLEASCASVARRSKLLTMSSEVKMQVLLLSLS